MKSRGFGLYKYHKQAGIILAAILFAVIVAIMPTVQADITIVEHGGLTPGSQPHGIVMGPDGNMWFTESAGDSIGHMTPDGTLIGEYPIPTAGSAPNSITVGPDGNIWFTGFSSEQIGRLNIADVATCGDGSCIDEFDLPAGVNRPHTIVAGPDGNLWFTQNGGHRIGMIPPDCPAAPACISEFPTPTITSAPYGITVGPDDNLWFTEYNIGQIARLRIADIGACGAGECIDEFPLDPARRPYDIVTGPDGNLWFTEENGFIGKMAPDGTLLDEYPAPTAGSDPHGIVAGPDGNLWVTARAAGVNQILMLTTDGDFTPYDIPTAASGPFSIAVGPDNTIWFTEANADQIGVVLGIITPTPPPTPPAPEPDSTGAPGLADTGQSQQLIIILGATLVTAGVGLGFRRFRASKS